MNLDTREFTPTQFKILQVLSDGKDHLRTELCRCLPDETAQLNPHITAMRKLLRPQGQDIKCTLLNRRIAYCWVQLCPPAYESRACHRGPPKVTLPSNSQNILLSPDAKTFISPKPSSGSNPKD